MPEGRIKGERQTIKEAIKSLEDSLNDKNEKEFDRKDGMRPEDFPGENGIEN